MPEETKTCVLVGRKVGDHAPRAFTIQGVFTGTDGKKKAETACKDEWWFCLKLDLNKSLKLADVPWDKVWYPSKDKS